MRLLLKDMLERKYRWPFVFFLVAAMLYWWGARQRDDHVKGPGQVGAFETRRESRSSTRSAVPKGNVMR